MKCFTRSLPISCGLHPHCFLLQLLFHCIHVQCLLSGSHKLHIGDAGVFVSFEDPVNFLQCETLRLHPEERLGRIETSALAFRIYDRVEMERETHDKKHHYHIPAAINHVHLGTSVRV